ncbi:MAG: hypothetical protein IPI44_12635 [Sulfuritalea sp.]|nr:hypothetical protein [Sulfuritalea sp.]
MSDLVGHVPQGVVAQLAVEAVPPTEHDADTVALGFDQSVERMLVRQSLANIGRGEALQFLDRQLRHFH